ncbi:MAG: Beta-xylosidase [Deltaproteobacteria bacterium ADurb.Bin207]|nr:MAG: Beta-xylosidase [Deltaproteobacteria bacterium ADurb.Bin207]HPY16328.1 glycoside hydrolase family 43 protein [Polyangiaceae bacterium]
MGLGARCVQQLKPMKPKNCHWFALPFVGMVILASACGDGESSGTVVSNAGTGGGKTSDAGQESGVGGYGGTGGDAATGGTGASAGTGGSVGPGGTGGGTSGSGGAEVGGSAGQAGSSGGAAGNAGSEGGSGGSPPPPCTTRITYGSSWIHGDNHPDDFDIASGIITWDGSCQADGGNSYATLSNGWKPYFKGKGTCVIALDYEGCQGVPASCESRVTYGPKWMPAPNHPDYFDDVQGALTWNGACHNDGSASYATLSNGWKPHFSGNSACDLAFRYTQCGGLYVNPVVGKDCPDPGVVFDGTQYVMACTGGGSGDAFPLRHSDDMVHWKWKGYIFPTKDRPSWAVSHFWAPEIHKIGSKFVAYFTAKHKNGALSIGAATASAALGPYKDIGKPLLNNPSMGLIDATHYEDPQGKHYLLWKEDGNAVGKPTPIYGQELASNGLSLVGSPVKLITNDMAWEGALVEGPWLIDHGGYYYLFYSANGYASASYGVSVARASSPLGPYKKAPAPLLRTAGAWAGPGHGSILTTPRGETWHIYHSWQAGHVGKDPGRVVLIDRVFWDGDWPTMLGAPSSVSLPPP